MNDLQSEKPLTTGEWFIVHLVLLVPLVNIIMLFVWAFGEGNISRRNFSRARLLFFAIGLALVTAIVIGLLLFTSVFAGVLMSLHGR